MADNRPKKHTLYRIYYGDNIVYVGRTNQPLSTRIRGHLLAKPMHRKLSIDLITRIEYAEFESEADMNLYEIYYILLLHPTLNVDDKTRDFPTVFLCGVNGGRKFWSLGTNTSVFGHAETRSLKNSASCGLCGILVN